MLGEAAGGLIGRQPVWTRPQLLLQLLARQRVPGGSGLVFGHWWRLVEADGLCATVSAKIDSSSPCTPRSRSVLCVGHSWRRECCYVSSGRDARFLAKRWHVGLRRYWLVEARRSRRPRVG